MAVAAMNMIHCNGTVGDKYQGKTSWRWSLSNLRFVQGLPKERRQMVVIKRVYMLVAKMASLISASHRGKKDKMDPTNARMSTQ